MGHLLICDAKTIRMFKLIVIVAFLSQAVTGSSSPGSKRLNSRNFCETTTIDNGSVNKKKVWINGQAKYTCIDGYMLDGIHDGFVKCFWNRRVKQAKWNRRAPSCVKQVTCTAIPIEDGSFDKEKVNLKE